MQVNDLEEAIVSFNKFFSHCAGSNPASCNRAIKELYMDDKRKSFEQLNNENASCLEYALNGFIRIYEENEELCNCDSCNTIKNDEKL